MKPTSPPGGPPPVLDVRGVGISFRGVRALDSVDLRVQVGGVVGLIGPNGAGKSTLLNCVSGLHRHEGEILLDGHPLTRLPAFRRARLGLARTFQTPSLIDHLPAVDNVMLGENRRQPERALRTRAVDLLAAVGAAKIEHDPVGALAHGDRRRVELARSLMSRPRLLLLDEPAAGLDHDEAFGLLTTVLRIGAEFDMACVLVEHDVELVSALARHVVVLDVGRVLAEGTPAEVTGDPRVVTAYLGQEVGV